MTHLSPQELQTWFARGQADDRARVIGHLAECETCRKALSELAMAAEPEEASATVFPLAEALPRGYAAHRPAKPVVRLGWMRPAYGLAAAAVIVLAVLWVTSPAPVEDDTVRGTELAALSPAGTVNSLEFRWASPFNAAKYRVVIRDAAGSLVHSAETTSANLTLDAAIRERFATMSDYSWTVSALDAAGEVIAESKPASFRYQP